MWRVILSGLALIAIHQTEVNSAEWWDNSIIYQVYPRSFKDSDGDGVGDLNGITSKLEHIRDTGATALWLSPIYESPQVDFGYDISNFTRIDPQYGTLDDFHQLIEKAKSLGLRVLLDLVPNHSSDQHDWFKKSINKVKPYDKYYVWRNAKTSENGTRLPPNNWLSIFGGPAWTWNEKRKQYYYHQFASAQPDLNYRDSKLRAEMDNVIKFWLDQGIDGFRVDAIIHMYEDKNFRDEPLSNLPGIPPDDYLYLTHPYTKDQNETYNIITRWRKIMDDHSAAHETDKKFGIVEAGSPLPLQMKYYAHGMYPFNFMFTAEFNKNSKPSEIASKVKELLVNIPRGESTNWVVGNHDISRTGSRYGPKRIDQMSMLAAVLPGITVIYNGDEIGMLDRPMSWEETVDPAGCNAGPERYEQKSRDPARTPFQWDNTTSAGFSTNPETWLPVNENYVERNLKQQETDKVSHFKVFQAIAKLKSTSEVVKSGQLEISDDNDKVLGVVRRLPHRVPIALLINVTDEPVKLNLATWLHLPDTVKVYAASVGSGLNVGQRVKTSHFELPPSATVILAGRNLSV